MEDILQTLLELEGVNGALVSDPTGQVLAYRAHRIYDESLLQQASRVILSAIDSIRLLQEDWESVTARFSEGKLLLRNLGAGGKNRPPLVLSLIADSRLNPSFAGVAIRVAIGKLNAAIESGGGVAALNASGLARQQAGKPVASSGGGLWASQPKVTGPEIAASGLSWSGLGTSSAIAGSGVAVADAASSAALTTCTKALARSVGPMSKVFVKEAVRKICQDRPFTQDQLPALVGELEKHIENRAEALRFRQAVVKP